MKELLNLQAKLNAPKDKYNKFGGYAYRSCEGILQALKPLLAAENCVLTLTDEIVQIADRVYVKAVATLMNAGGAYVQTTAYAREELTKKGMDAAQVTGAASSYARKYALNGLFAIDDVKDADTEEMTRQQRSSVTDRVRQFLTSNTKAFEYYQQQYSHNASLDEFTNEELLTIYNELTKRGYKL